MSSILGEHDDLTVAKRRTDPADAVYETTPFFVLCFRSGAIGMCEYECEICSRATEMYLGCLVVHPVEASALLYLVGDWSMSRRFFLAE